MSGCLFLGRGWPADGIIGGTRTRFVFREDGVQVTGVNPFLVLVDFKRSSKGRETFPQKPEINANQRAVR